MCHLRVYTVCLANLRRTFQYRIQKCSDQRLLQLYLFKILSVHDFLFQDIAHVYSFSWLIDALSFPCKRTLHFN